MEDKTRFNVGDVTFAVFAMFAMLPGGGAAEPVVFGRLSTSAAVDVCGTP